MRYRYWVIEQLAELGRHSEREGSRIQEIDSSHLYHLYSSAQSMVVMSRWRKCVRVRRSTNQAKSLWWTHIEAALMRAFQHIPPPYYGTRSHRMHKGQDTKAQTPVKKSELVFQIVIWCPNRSTVQGFPGRHLTFSNCYFLFPDKTLVCRLPT